jgi:hypothetical protein
MSIQRKLRISNRKTALKYRRETRVLNKSDSKRSEAAEKRLLTPSLGYTKWDYQRNVNIREKLTVRCIIEEIHAYQNNWKERVERMQDEGLPNVAVK